MRGPIAHAIELPDQRFLVFGAAHGSAPNTSVSSAAKRGSCWCYSVLPFVEQTGLHQMGTGLTGAERYEKFAERDATALSLFICPTRRTPKA